MVTFAVVLLLSSERIRALEFASREVPVGKAGLAPVASGHETRRYRRINQQSAEMCLAEDVDESRIRATELYSRSTLMLVAGVVMAFIGVAVFYFSLPSYSSVDANFDLRSYLARAIRPTGILIFLEGIAWFLLRQYRALIEDYKAFHRLYLKRANYLVSLKTLSMPEVSQAQMLLAASMLSEDLTGRLKPGETTENIEAVKGIEPNPVFAILLSVIERTKKKD